MRCTPCLLAALAATASAQETVLGVYIFSRHGDRTAKSTPPTNLTDLGYSQVYTSGTYFRNRYVASGASTRIYGINSDVVKQSQINASAPSDTVLQNSAVGFLQGIYPPVGSTLGSATLRNGSTVEAPLNGYQLIPLGLATSGSNAESSAWLQGSTGCGNAVVSSNNYLVSQQYLDTYNSTTSFYAGVEPMINRTFTAAQSNFKNAYAIFDLLNVANIHNASNNFPSADLYTNDTAFQLRTLADQHEFGLAYNNSEPIRAITGSIIAAQVLSALNSTVGGKGAKLNIQFGAYGGMMSFFGLANLTQVNPDFFGVPDYASTLTWELVTNSTVNSTSFPPASEISVRFLFHNGTTSNESEPIEYPLFHSNQSPLPWNDFVSGMNKFAVSSQAQWCQVCGNSTGVCSSENLDSGSGSSGSSSTHGGSNSNSNGNASSSSSSSSSSGGGMSLAVAGVIGAMVTLAVILGVEGLILLAGGLRVVSKKRLAGAGVSPPSSVSQTKA